MTAYFVYIAYTVNYQYSTTFIVFIIYFLYTMAVFARVMESAEIFAWQRYQNQLRMLQIYEQLILQANRRQIENELANNNNDAENLSSGFSSEYYEEIKQNIANLENPDDNPHNSGQNHNNLPENQKSEPENLAQNLVENQKNVPENLAQNLVENQNNLSKNQPKNLESKKLNLEEEKNRDSFENIENFQTVLEPEKQILPPNLVPEIPRKLSDRKHSTDSISDSEFKDAKEEWQFEENKEILHEKGEDVQKMIQTPPEERRKAQKALGNLITIPEAESKYERTSSHIQVIDFCDSRDVDEEIEGISEKMKKYASCKTTNL